MTGSLALADDQLPVLNNDEGGENFEWLALLGKARKAMAEGREIRISPTLIRPLAGQPRVFFSVDSIKRLADSMKTVGQIVPGIIRKIDGAGGIEYELLDGERRWRAAIQAGLTYRATLIDVDDESIPFIVAAVANFNREGHTPTEVSDSVEKMVKLKLPMDEIARILGITPFWAYQMRGLQNLHPKVRDMLDPNLPKDQMLPVTAAIQISKVDVVLQHDLAKRVLDRTLTLKSLRGEAVRVSKAAGAHIRERKRPPRKQWDSILALSGQLLRTARDLENALMEDGVSQTLRDRAALDLKGVRDKIEAAGKLTEKCKGLVSGTRLS